MGSWLGQLSTGSVLGSQRGVGLDSAARRGQGVETVGQGLGGSLSRSNRTGSQNFELRILGWRRRQPGNLCFQILGLEPFWLSFLIPHPMLHPSLPSKPQFRISHGGCGVQNCKHRELVARLEGGRGGVQRSSERRLPFGDHLLIADGPWLKLWSLGTLSALFLLK